MMPNNLYAFCSAAAMACVLLIPIEAVASAGALTARVQNIGGVPRLMVNGKAVRPRIFWGSPGSSPIPIAAGEQTLSYTFSPIMDEPDCAMLHLRFQHIQSNVLIHGVGLVDLTTGKTIIDPASFDTQAVFDREWAYWPPNAPGLTGSVKIVPADASGHGGGVLLAQRQPAPGTDWSDTHIFHKPNLALTAAHRYRLDVSLTSDTPTLGTFSFYRRRADGPFEALGGVRDAFGSQIALAAKSGVNIVSCYAALPWAKPGQAQDMSGIDALIRLILNRNPQALILPRISVCAPTWWLDAHPDAEMCWSGKAGHERTETVASRAFRDEASVQIASLVKHMEATYGDHILGYHLSGQNTGEWFYMDSWGRDVNGYAPADTLAFRQWLTATYGGDSALRRAWGRDDISLTTAPVPTPGERQSGATDLRDPGSQQNVIDFTRFQQDSMADCILDFAHVVRRATQGRKVVVFFYGYVHEFGPMLNGSGNSGHYALRRLLDSPDIDAMASPWSYVDRGLNGTGPLMAPAESCALAGKLYFAEDDTATALSSGDFPGWRERARTASETNKVLMRNSAQMTLRNIGTWWMDLGMTGWFDDPAYWSALDKFSSVEQSQLENVRPFRPEIASVVDENSAQLLGWRNRMGQLLSDSRFALGRCGAPYGQYLQDDVAAGRVHAKVYVFLSAYRFNASSRAALRKAVKGASSIWCCAPGYIDGDHASLEAVKELTGFDVKIVQPASAVVSPVDAGIRLGLTSAFGPVSAPRPTLAVTDARPGEALAVFPDGSVAIAMRKTAIGTSIFVGTSALSPELIRLAAKAAGAHLFADHSAAVFANGPYIAVHATQDGLVTLDTGKRSAILDAMTGQRLGMGPVARLPMTAGDNVIIKD
ncbi:MAG: beta-galactosidase [Capsulimonadaceae bacterium]|nr:beta-galactosidase [Capsulimonadaceae bacterium]